MRAKRAALEASQADHTVQHAGYTLRPAIGRTGGADNVGWEVIPPRGCGPTWYVETLPDAMEAVQRHRRCYG